MTHNQFVWLNFLSAFLISLIIHEYGHFVVARRLGVTVISVLIGIGPRLFGWVDRQNVSWQFFALPLCGSNILEVNKPDENPRILALRLIAVFAGGPLANFLLSAIVFFLVLMIWGASYTPPDVTDVEPGSTGEQAGIRPGDRIVSINGISVRKMTDIAGIIQQQPRGPMPVLLLNDGQERTVTLSPLYLPMHGRLGPDAYSVRVGIFHSGAALFEKLSWSAALRLSARRTIDIAMTPVHEIVTLASHGPPKEPSTHTPVVKHLPPERLPLSKFEVIDFLTALALVSGNFGLVNLYPIVRFDGGQIVLAAVTLVSGRQPTNVIRWGLLGFSTLMIFVITILVARDQFTHIGLLS